PGAAEGERRDGHRRRPVAADRVRISGVSYTQGECGAGAAGQSRRNIVEDRCARSPAPRNLEILSPAADRRDVRAMDSRRGGAAVEVSVLHLAAVCTLGENEPTTARIVSELLRS